MSVSTGVGAVAALEEEVRVLRNMVQMLARQRESDMRISGVERNAILSAISEVRQDIATLPGLDREIHALQMTVAGLQTAARRQ